MSSKKKAVFFKPKERNQFHLNEKVYILRHAQSRFNAAEGGVLSGYDKTKNPHWDIDLMDAQISDVGYQQTQDAADSYLLPNLGIVFVSPMRRALQTCYYVFKDHPNWDNIKFIVEPNIIEFLKDTPTIPEKGIQDKLDEFRKLFRDSNGKTLLDTTLIDRVINEQMLRNCNDDLWFVGISGKEDEDNIRKLMMNSKKPQQDLLTYMEKTGFYESKANIRARGKVFKETLRTLVRAQAGKNNMQIVVVGHQLTFEAMYGTMMKNCEFRPLSYDEVHEF